MANYNPHSPYILGNEWVPIRNAYYASDGITERGYQFNLATTAVPVSGAFYVSEPPGNRLAQACDVISVYPAGRETLTGPVRKLNIKPSAITVTNVGSGSIDASEGVAALLNAEDGKFIIFLADTGSFEQLQVSFDTEAHAAVLLGKRVLDLRLRYSMNSPNVANASNMTFRVHNQNAFRGVIYPGATEVTNTADVSKISTLSLTELNPTWDMTANFRGQRTVLPWRFQELNRFRAGEPAATALTIFLQNNAEISTVLLGFMDLEVIFCEETRVLYGGFRTYDSSFSNFPVLVEEEYNVGAVAVRMFNPTSVPFSQGNTLLPGDYVVTVYHRDIASLSIRQGTPEIHAVRPYFNLSTVQPIRVNQTTTENAQFTADVEDVVTHITLHTSTAIVTGAHAYGISVGAPVYAAITATQEIEDDVASGSYTQVRFYARRFGNTTVPLTFQTTGGANTVSIGVAEFDALDEIVDGWREVNLTFPTPVPISPTGGTSDWRWVAAGELAGNQWQVLTASGPSGAWGPNAAAASTGPATYWAPNGSTVNLTWQSPTVTGNVSDAISDAVVFFSQDPPTVTGFAVTTTSIPVSGVSQVCGVDPRCVPTAISGLRASWNYATLCDTFDRIVSSGWGTPNVGPVWTSTLVNVSESVAGGRAFIRHNTASSSLIMASSVSVANVDVTVTDVTWPVQPIGANPAQIVRARFLDANNYVEIELFRGASGDTSYRLLSRLAGVDSSTGFVSLSFSAITTLNIRLQAVDTTLRAKIWPSNQGQPSTWTATLTATFTGAGGIQYIQDISSVTNAFPVTSTIGSITAVTSEAMYDTYFELQRRDLLTDWQTIMLSSGPCVGSFNDFEARVGVLSEYRIRTLNVMDFAGPWVTGSGTIPSPGVTISGDANSVLIFTSNEATSASLAYVMQWESEPIELFAFPEADFTTLQRLFGRDYFLAVRPEERGGERFERTILVNAAAISLPSLPNFNNLRDLAWDDLNYVCVRDELGNRWFANVLVPEGTVRSNRTLYLAKIVITKVTDIPTPVDPGV